MCGLLQYANYLQILLAQRVFFSDREQNVSSWNLRVNNTFLF